MSQWTVFQKIAHLDAADKKADGRAPTREEWTEKDTQTGQMIHDADKYANEEYGMLAPPPQKKNDHDSLGERGKVRVCG